MVVPAGARTTRESITFPPPFYFSGNDLAFKPAEIRFAGRGGTLEAGLCLVSELAHSGQEKEKRGGGRRGFTSEDETEGEEGRDGG